MAMTAEQFADARRHLDAVAAKMVAELAAENTPEKRAERARVKNLHETRSRLRYQRDCDAADAQVLANKAELVYGGQLEHERVYGTGY